MLTGQDVSLENVSLEDVIALAKKQSIGSWHQGHFGSSLHEIFYHVSADGLGIELYMDKAFFHKTGRVVVRKSDGSILNMYSDSKIKKLYESIDTDYRQRSAKA